VYGATRQQGKRRKSSKQAKADHEARLQSKLQAESLKVHGEPLGPPKNAPGKTKGQMSIPHDPPYPMPPPPFPRPEPDEPEPEPDGDDPLPAPLPS
jgi:hypothetical protein